MSFLWLTPTSRVAKWCASCRCHAFKWTGFDAARFLDNITTSLLNVSFFFWVRNQMVIINKADLFVSHHPRSLRLLPAESTFPLTGSFASCPSSQTGPQQQLIGCGSLNKELLCLGSGHVSKCTLVCWRLPLLGAAFRCALLPGPGSPSPPRYRPTSGL